MTPWERTASVIGFEVDQCREEGCALPHCLITQIESARKANDEKVLSPPSVCLKSLSTVDWLKRSKIQSVRRKTMSIEVFNDRLNSAVLESEMYQVSDLVRRTHAIAISVMDE